MGGLGLIVDRRRRGIPVSRAAGRGSSPEHARGCYEPRLVGEPRTSVTEKWWRWRRDLSDGSRAAVEITRKPDGRTLVTLTHSKLSGTESIAHRKLVWKPLSQQISSE